MLKSIASLRVSIRLELLVDRGSGVRLAAAAFWPRHIRLEGEGNTTLESTQQAESPQRR